MSLPQLITLRMVELQMPILEPVADLVVLLLVPLVALVPGPRVLFR
jgi:hypothetical protein